MVNFVRKDFYIDTTVQGTTDIDVVFPLKTASTSSGGARAFDLAEIDLKRGPNNTFIITNATNTGNDGGKITLKSFDPKVDIIRTSDGDFTLQEILDHGNNAPFYKQAKINAQVMRNPR